MREAAIAEGKKPLTTVYFNKGAVKKSAVNKGAVRKGEC